MYYEIEGIIEYLPAWTVRDVKALSVRERKHWFKRLTIKKENSS